jgi:hypothetical protein
MARLCGGRDIVTCPEAESHCFTVPSADADTAVLLAVHATAQISSLCAVNDKFNEGCLKVVVLWRVRSLHSSALTNARL